MTQNELNEQRKRYMTKEITHDEFYLWLADGIGLTTGDLPVSRETLISSTDRSFNDIPLALWDQRHAAVSRHAVGLSWSLCETVCCLKAVARRLVGRTLEEK